MRFGSVRAVWYMIILPFRVLAIERWGFGVYKPINTKTVIYLMDGADCRGMDLGWV